MHGSTDPLLVDLRVAVCGSTHTRSDLGIAMVAIVGAPLALAAVIVIGSVFGSFRRSVK